VRVLAAAFADMVCGIGVCVNPYILYEGHLRDTRPRSFDAIHLSRDSRSRLFVREGGESRTDSANGQDTGL
jgi:hypothetical protein